MDLKREILMVNCADMDQPTPDNSWGSTGPLSFGKIYENVVGIRLIKHNLHGMTALVYVPEWAPYCVGSYAYKPEITVVTGLGDTNELSNHLTRRINQRIPTYLTANNNFYVLQASNCTRDRSYITNPSTLQTLTDADDNTNYVVAEVNNRESPFSFRTVSHAVWIISNQRDNSTSYGYRNFDGSDGGKHQYTHTYLQNITEVRATVGPYFTYKQPGWDSSLYANNQGDGRISFAGSDTPIGGLPPFFVYEIIMVDETSHIARMPNADQLAIEYKDKVEQTGRYKSNAAEINKAISAFKSFSK